MKRYLIILMAIIGLCSCAKNSTTKNPVEIAFTAVIENGTNTKAPFVLNVPTDKNPVTAAVWASTTSQSYKGDQKVEPTETDTVIDYHNTTCFTSGKRQLLDHQIFYPANHDTVYFVAFCPRSDSGWHIKEENEGSGKWNVAHYIFDGKTDVMFSHEIKKNDEMAAIPPTLIFHHVLTWIKFNIVADDNDAIETWGKVQRITIDSKKEIYINVSSNTCSFGGDVDPEFPTYCIDKYGVSTDIPFEDQNIALTTTPQEVAYTLCAAVIASPNDTDNEYSITIDTENRPDTKAVINLKDATNLANFSGNTEGCQFTVTLRFKLGDNIVTKAEITEWTNGGFGFTPVEEK